MGIKLLLNNTLSFAFRQVLHYAKPRILGDFWQKFPTLASKSPFFICFDPLFAPAFRKTPGIFGKFDEGRKRIFYENALLPPPKAPLQGVKAGGFTGGLTHLSAYA